MIRKTHTTKNSTDSLPSQHELDKFWDWLEAYPVEEMWRVQANGDMVLVVDEYVLTKILFDDQTKAYEDFEVFEERERETGAWVVHNLPYQLCGTYTIKGVYAANQKLVDGERTYFFSQEF